MSGAASSTTSSSKEGGGGRSKLFKKSSLDPAVLDDYVLRLILNSALIDMPPKKQSTAALARSPVPHVRPYWQHALAEHSVSLPSYVDKTRCFSSSSSANTTSISSSSPFGRRRPPGSPSKLEQQQFEEGGRSMKGGMAIQQPSSPYVDTVRFERAKILALAHDLDEVETIEERIARRRANGPPKAVTRRARLSLEATSEETACFQEQYARYVTRLSYLSQQDHDEDLDDPLDPESERQRLRQMSMAVALSESIREVMADPIVIDLIKEATITRMRGMGKKEEKANSSSSNSKAMRGE